MDSPAKPASLPRSWWLDSRTFWVGLLVSAFFVCLMIDSFRYFSVYRTIVRGSFRDLWGMAPTTTSKPETGSFVISLEGGCLGLAWFDRFGPGRSYMSNNERIPTPEDYVKTFWWPRVVAQGGSGGRVHGVGVPTWMFLAVWLTVWTRLLVKARRRRRAYLVPAS